MLSSLFEAELNDFKMVHNVLKSVLFKEYAVFRVTEEGLQLALEEMRCVETKVYIPNNMFATFRVFDPNVEIKFRISLKVFTECLHIFGEDGNPSLRMTYKGDGAPLCLILKHNEESITVDCEIKTLEVEEFDGLSLADECNLNKVVLNAAPLVEILHDLDNSSDELELLLSPDAPYLKITTNSLSGQCVVDIPKHSEMITLFQCKKETCSKYTFSFIRQILKVLGYATKVSILTGESELLGLQLFFSTEDKQMYVEYFVTAQYS